MSNLNSPEFIEAVQLWTGWGQSMAPSRNDKRLMARFGEDVAARLLPLIKSLEDDFYSSDARLVAANLQEMEKLASERFKEKHPGIADEIVKALAWCYTFDFK
jgi:hypothetical protein